MPHNDNGHIHDYNNQLKSSGLRTRSCFFPFFFFNSSIDVVRKQKINQSIRLPSADQHSDDGNDGNDHTQINLFFVMVALGLHALAPSLYCLRIIPHKRLNCGRIALLHTLVRLQNFFPLSLCRSPIPFSFANSALISNSYFYSIVNIFVRMIHVQPTTL